MSGTALAAKYHNEKIVVVGCEPAMADDAYRSKKAGYIIPVDKPNTMADGLRASIGEKTFPIIRDFVDEIVLVSEEEIVGALRLTFERMKIIIETSSAVTLAALLYNKLDVRSKKVGVIVSGGNIDLSKFYEML